jgi:hypothetical protein
MRKFIVILVLGLTTFYMERIYPTGAASVANASENEWAENIRRSADLEHVHRDGDRRVTIGGANRVDQDLYPYHAGDINRFGDDGAYNSIRGGSSLGGLPAIHDSGP